MSSLRQVDQWLHGHVIYPAVLRAIGEGSLSARLAQLHEIERMAPDGLRAYQETRLAAILDWAESHSPYYRERWPAAKRGEAPHERLRQLPLIDKSDLQEHFSALRGDADVGRVSRKVTGGSTGQAVTVLKDRHATAAERAAMWLAYGWFGVKPGDRVARFWGAPFATGRRWVTRAADYAMNRIRFSAFAFSDDDLERYWSECVSFAPDYLHGYVSMLEAFAGFLERRGHDGRRLPLKSIIATSEALSDPQRAQIERVFGAPVQIEYGCGEAGPIGYTCDRGGFHLMTADLVIELLDADGSPAAAGEAGEVVITDLNNLAMPLVRYRLGDFAVAGGACTCGRAFPTIAKVWGRAYDFVEGPDGRRYHGEFFMYLFEDLRRGGTGVRQFQVTQRDEGPLEIAVIAPPEQFGAISGEIQRLLAKRLPGTEAEVSRVDRLERTGSGKMQVIRNLRTRPGRDAAHPA